MTMTADEARAARAELGLTTEQLAAELGVTEGEVIAWEAGRIRLRQRFAQQLAWLAASARREDALDAAGVPHCPEADRLTAAVEAIPPGKTSERTRVLEQMVAHARDCPTCVARRQYIDEHLPAMPPMPLPAWLTVLGRLRRLISRLPRWLRPAAWGALVVGTIVVIRATFTGLTHGFSVDLLWMALAAIGVGAYLGTVGGLVYAVVREPFRRFGRPGDYLTGLAVMYAYVLALGLPLAIFNLDPQFRTIGGWVVLAFLGTVFGLLIGRWFHGSGGGT
jgi:transcriptional regulator with XRE-family HTH domain